MFKIDQFWPAFVIGIHAIFFWGHSEILSGTNDIFLGQILQNSRTLSGTLNELENNFSLVFFFLIENNIYHFFLITI